MAGDNPINALRPSVPPHASSLDIVDLYERHARNWAADRGKELIERAWLERFLELAPAGGAILDLGCGSGEPIAGFLIERGCHLTGVDTSATLISFSASRFPGETWIAADMRTLRIASRFDGILAWDSLFHLSPEDQRKMFPIFAAHAAAGAPLMFTSGPAEGVAIGVYRGEQLYHASLATSEYQSLLEKHGFEIMSHAVEDRACGGHTVWLSRLR